MRTICRRIREVGTSPRAQTKVPAALISVPCRHIILFVLLSFTVFAILRISHAQVRIQQVDIPLENIERPATIIELLSNLKTAADNGLLLQGDFYSDNNLKRFSGGSRVKWDQISDQHKKWGEILDFGTMIAPFVDGGHKYSGLVLFFQANFGATGGISARWHASFRGPNNATFSDVEAVFGTNWNEQVYARPFHNSPPATRTRGNMRIIYVISDKGLQGESLLRFKPDATIDWVDITVKENPQ